MNALLRIGLVVLLIISIFAGMSGCISPGSGSQTSSALPADKYVAIYQEYNEQGVVIEGNMTITPAPGPSLEPFDYDGSKGLSDQYSLATGDFQIFTGIYYYYATPASGHTTACYGGFGGQYPLHLVANLTIHGIDKDGTINASYGDQPVILRTGDRWQSPIQTRVVDKISVIDGESGVSSFQPVEPIRYNSTWIVENKGMFSKSNLKK